MVHMPLCLEVEILVQLDFPEEMSFLEGEVLFSHVMVCIDRPIHSIHCPDQTHH